MSEYRYTLDPGSKKFPCPGCGKRRAVRYIDTATGEYMPEEFARCDRAVNCGYHENPYKAGVRHDVDTPKKSPIGRQLPKPISFIPTKILKQSRAAYHENNLVTFLLSKFPGHIVAELIGMYHLGTSKHWHGSTVYWQIDEWGRVRSGKIMLHDSATGKRVKEPYPHITWAHKALKLENFNLSQVFFGQHLLKQFPNKPVALVESEKSALVGAGYMPEYLWLGAGSLTSLTVERCKALRGREVALFPDAGCYDRWDKKAREIKAELPKTLIYTSDTVELFSTPEQHSEGADIADLLLTLEYSEPESLQIAA